MMTNHGNSSLGMLRASVLKEKTDPLELGSQFMDSYLTKDEQYPEIGQMALRKYAWFLI